jgi:hypothetical protein
MNALPWIRDLVGKPRVYSVSVIGLLLLVYSLASPDGSSPAPEAALRQLSLGARIGRLLAICWAVAMLALGALLLLLAVSALLLGVKAIEFMPREFGGAAPCRAVLEIASSEMSPELLAAMAGQSAAANMEKVVRTKPMLVHPGDGPWTLRMAADPPRNGCARSCCRPASSTASNGCRTAQFSLPTHVARRSSTVTPSHCRTAKPSRREPRTQTLALSLAPSHDAILARRQRASVPASDRSS